jgi:hypothetical protein
VHVQLDESIDVFGGAKDDVPAREANRPRPDGDPQRAKQLAGGIEARP